MLYTILLCALGHIVRDGYPAMYNDTVARIVGCVFCIVGALLAYPNWQGAVMGLAIGAGFMTDLYHAKGQDAKTLKDSVYLLISGATSISLLAVAAYFLAGAWWVLLFALLKPPIWFISARVKLPPFFVATRLSAILWGSAIGASLWLI